MRQVRPGKPGCPGVTGSITKAADLKKPLGLSFGLNHRAERICTAAGVERAALF